MIMRDRMYATDKQVIKELSYLEQMQHYLFVSTEPYNISNKYADKARDMRMTKNRGTLQKALKIVKFNQLSRDIFGDNQIFSA